MLIMNELIKLVNGKLKIVQDSDPLTEVDLFKLKNKLSDAEFDYLMLRKKIGKQTLGNIPMPNGEIKNIVK